MLCWNGLRKGGDKPPFFVGADTRTGKNRGDVESKNEINPAQGLALVPCADYINQTRRGHAKTL